MNLCGCKEECFEIGDAEWGHFGGVMCKHLGEYTRPGTKEYNVHYCDKTKKDVKTYFSKSEYEKLKSEYK